MTNDKGLIRHPCLHARHPLFYSFGRWVQFRWMAVNTIINP